MEQDVSYTLKSHSHRSKSKGIVAAVILLLAAVLALISYKIIEIGAIAIKVNTEKQLLDTCGIITGQIIINTNDIEAACSQVSLNQCIELVPHSNSSMQCVDLGIQCDNDNNCERVINVTSSYNPGRGEVSKSIDVYTNEENHEVNIIDAAVIMLLDFSGSMQGNRIDQLKNTVRDFINSDFNLSYSVILYNDSIISTSNIGKGQNHNQTALSIINNTNEGGGTSFILPLQEAISQVQSTNYEVYYILLISDGSPNEGLGPSQTFVNSNIKNIDDDFCIFSSSANPCITIFTLGVDNANTNILGSLSGNTISQDINEYMYTVNANQTEAAFNAIIEEIMCRIGPVIAEGALHVFNNLEILEQNIDYVFDINSKILKFYDVEPFNICTEMLNNNSNITLRWGNPRFEVLD
jgi:uncharacterized protein YegL